MTTVSNVTLYEKFFLALSGALLIACLGALFYASASMGIQLPSRAGEIDPAAVYRTPPFDRVGVHRTGKNSFDVVMIGQIWAFLPAEIRVPAGADVTFVATTPDVMHGLHVERTRVNMMLIPGQISRNTYRFDTPGEYNILCHEYCGQGHHTMFAKLIVE